MEQYEIQEHLEQIREHIQALKKAGNYSPEVLSLLLEPEGLQPDDGMFLQLAVQAPVGIVIVEGSDYKIRFANPALQAILNIPGNLAGLPIGDVWPQGVEPIVPALEEVYASGKPYYTVTTAVPALLGDENQKHYLSLTCTKLGGEGDQKKNLLVVSQDTTEQIRYQRQLISERSRLNAVIMSVPQAIVLLDQSGEVVLSNPGAEGLSIPDDLFVQNDLEGEKRIFFPDNGPNEKEDLPLYRSLHHGETFVNLEMKVHAKNGQARYFLASSAPIMDRKGTITGAVGVFQDITKRKKLENDLLASRERVRDVLSCIAENYFEISRDWHFTEFNQNGLDYFGLTHDEVIGKSLSDIFPDYLSTMFDEELNEAAEKRKSIQFEAYLPTHNRWIEVYAYSHEDGIGVYFHDVTGRKLTENALQTAKQRLENILGSITDAFITVDLEGNIMDANPVTAREIFIQPLGTLFGKNLWENYAGLFQEGFQRKIQNAFLNGTPVHFETKINQQAGLWFEVHAYPRKTYIEIYMRNVTLRKQAEEALLESHRRMDMALRNIPILMYTMDRELRYTWIYASQNGIKPEEYIGRRDDEIFPDEEISQLLALKKQALEEGVRTRQEIRRKRQGAEQILDVTIEPLRSSEGETLGVTVVSLEITEQRQLEEKSRAAAMQIEIQRHIIGLREQERLEIARDLHDGPMQELVGITFALQLLETNLKDPEAANNVRTIKRTLQKQIGELRAFAGELRPPTLFRFGLVQAIKSHLVDFCAKYPYLAVQVEEKSNEKSLPENIRVVLYRIYQETLNNVVRHSQASEVKILYEKNEEWVVLEVRDNGIGFELPSDWMIFARDRHFGLVGMQERVNTIGGEIVVESVPGQGTCVRVEAPL